MKYTEMRKDLQELRSKHKEARTELAELESSVDPLHEKFESSYIQLTEKRAEAEIGDCSKADVKKAEKRNKDIKAKIQETKEAIDTKKHVVRLLEEKLSKAELEFSSLAKEYHAKKLKPHFEKIDEALATANDSIQAINDHRNELQKDHLSTSLLKGIDYGSEALISKKKMASMEKRNFITQTKNK